MLCAVEQLISKGCHGWLWLWLWPWLLLRDQLLLLLRDQLLLLLKDRRLC